MSASLPCLVALSHTPLLLQVYDFRVEKNDVVILGSDGIFDNLFEGQLIAVVNSVQQNGGGPEVGLVDNLGVFPNLPLPKALILILKI